MNIAEIILLIMFSISLLLSARLHGETKKTKENFWITLITVAIQFLIMKWAGLF